MHKNAAAKEFNTKNKIKCIEWPNYLSDLNPIENLWGLMKEKLSKIIIKLSRTQNKIIRIKEEIERSFIENCFYIMKKRLKEVIKTKVNKIKYKIYLFILIIHQILWQYFLFLIFSKNFVDI